MDLQRRQPAGELSALVGERAAEADARMRVHRFRRVARTAVERADPAWRDLLDAYARGVNAGSPRSRPHPSSTPSSARLPNRGNPRTPCSPCWPCSTACRAAADIEQAQAQLLDTLPGPLFRFLTQAGSDWDAPVTGGALPRPPLPGPEVANLRAWASARAPSSMAGAPRAPWCAQAVLHYCVALSAEAAAGIGSNNWAVDGARSATGHALVANDMHLEINVPILWYRASLVFPDPADPLRPLQVTGVTLPGLPPMVVGSTGFVAWGFTNTAGDWSDLVRIEPDPRDPSRYLTPAGPQAFEGVDEVIAIKGAPPRRLPIRATIWGPVVWTDRHGREYAQRWVAHDADVLASDLTRIERARTIDELRVAVNGIGMPHQNRHGRPLRPHRVGHRRRHSQASWLGRVDAGVVGGRHAGLGRLRRDGRCAAHRRSRGGPHLTANAPVVDGDMLRQIGDGGYADGIRARIIRDRLRALPRATVGDMLSVQLDDSALFLERWRTLALDLLARPAAGLPAERADRRRSFRAIIERTWTGRAEPASAGYRLVRTFRSHVARAVLEFLTAPTLAADPGFVAARLPHTEGPIWAVVSEQPPHLLDPRFDSWDALLLAMVDAATEELTADGGSLEDRTWGEANRARIAHAGARHPALRAVAGHARRAQRGDVFTPRAHSPRTGPSSDWSSRPGGGRGHPAHADRAERASAVTALRRHAPGLGRRPAGAAAARPGHPHPAAPARQRAPRLNRSGRPARPGTFAGRRGRRRLPRPSGRAQHAPAPAQQRRLGSPHAAGVVDALTHARGGVHETVEEHLPHLRVRLDVESLEHRVAGDGNGVGDVPDGLLDERGFQEGDRRGLVGQGPRDDRAATGQPVLDEILARLSAEAPGFVLVDQDSDPGQTDPDLRPGEDRQRGPLDDDDLSGMTVEELSPDRHHVLHRETGVEGQRQRRPGVGVDPGVRLHGKRLQVRDDLEERSHRTGVRHLPQRGLARYGEQRQRTATVASAGEWRCVIVRDSAAASTPPNSRAGTRRMSDSLEWK